MLPYSVKEWQQFQQEAATVEEPRSGTIYKMVLPVAQVCMQNLHMHK